MEHTITGQEEEIRKQESTNPRLTEEMRLLVGQREFYRAERDFYRKTLGEVGIQLPTARPSSPTGVLLAIPSRPSADIGGVASGQSQHGRARSDSDGG